MQSIIIMNMSDVFHVLSLKIFRLRQKSFFGKLYHVTKRVAALDLCTRKGNIKSVADKYKNVPEQICVQKRELKYL